MSVVAGLLGELSDVGRVPAGGYDRLAWTPVDLECRQWFHQCADALDLEVETDRNGNLWAWWAPELAGPAFVAGSHLDSVPNGGAYDGALGVASAFAAVALLRREGFVPTRPFAIVAFVDGEGARFGAGRIGSRLMVGSVTAAETLGLTDRDGTTMAEAMTSAGRDVSDVGRDDALLRRIGEFVELHIEQGHMPTRSGGHHGLAAAGSPVGVADRILPHGRWRVDVVGRQDHAGTTPMRARRDPMIGLARVILTVREAAVTHGAQASVGKTHITPGAVETVAAAATLWIDASASTANAVQRVVTDVRMRTGLEPAQESWSAGVEFDPAFTAAAAAILGDAPVLASGGSHDAGVLAGAGIPSAMLWVRNASGISHSPSEHIGDDDCEAGVEALIALIRTRTSAGAEDLFHFNQ